MSLHQLGRPFVVLKDNSVLDDVWKIPIQTLLFAMRISSKYDMEDIRVAITRITLWLARPNEGFGHRIPQPRELV